MVGVSLQKCLMSIDESSLNRTNSHPAARSQGRKYLQGRHRVGIVSAYGQHRLGIGSPVGKGSAKGRHRVGIGL